MIEVTETGYSAYSPDIPGCVATGATQEATLANMREAIAFDIEGLREEGFPIPTENSKQSFHNMEYGDISGAGE